MVWLLAILGVPVGALVTLWLVGERGHLILPSTRAAVTKSGVGGSRGGWLNALHGYVYARWTFQYIKLAVHRLLPRMTPRVKHWWAEHYHGKVLPTELACAIIRLDHDIKRTDLEQVIPYSAARDILLSKNPKVTLMECACRHSRENPCQPTAVCMLVGGGDFVLEHQPSRSKRVTQQEALDLLEAEHERGHVHTAYFKDACDNRFYAICNCCKCCCGGLEAMTKYGVPMVASSGYVAQVDEAACIACHDCEEACPFDAITVYARSTVNWEKCMGCGVCEGFCEMDAVTLVVDERKGLPLDVRKIGLEAVAA
jgi:Pyruvate/2-oxoacid:ferredoxin oxidoreductase delta subunit